jgi:hypothetical protein
VNAFALAFTQLRAEFVVRSSPDRIECAGLIGRVGNCVAEQIGAHQHG